MKRIFLFLIVLFLYQAIQAQDAARINNWNKDLDYLQLELPKKHYNLFATRSQKEFEAGIRTIQAEIPNLTDFQIILRIQQLIARFGDSHTMANFTQFFDNKQILPLGLLWAGGNIYIVQTTTENRELLGCQLTAINQTPVNVVTDSLSTLFTIDNQAIVKALIPQFIPSLQILDVFGFTNGAPVMLGLRTLDGRDITYNLGAVLPDNKNKISFQPDSMCFSLKNKKLFFTDNYDPQEKIYHILYNKCGSREIEMEYGNPERAAALPSFKEFEEKIFRTLHQEHPDKIIFDLRYNGGGNSRQGTALIEKLAVFLKQHPRTKIYVVLGRETFSSAILNALDFKRLTSAVFIGEETAGKPNHFGEVRSFQLPASGLQVNHSTKYFKNSDEDVNTFKPDVVLEPLFSDFIKGIDPVYEWVKAR